MISVTSESIPLLHRWYRSDRLLFHKVFGGGTRNGAVDYEFCIPLLYHLQPFYQSAKFVFQIPHIEPCKYDSQLMGQWISENYRATLNRARIHDAEDIVHFLSSKTAFLLYFNLSSFAGETLRPSLNCFCREQTSVCRSRRFP